MGYTWEQNLKDKRTMIAVLCHELHGCDTGKPVATFERDVKETWTVCNFLWNVEKFIYKFRRGD